MATLTPKGAATRQRLIDTALELFAARGYEATTMRAIAVQAGVSTGLAYRYFDGKETLVAELYAQLAEAFVEEVEWEDGPWTDRGLAALDASLAVLAPYRGALAALMSSSATQHDLSPPLARSAPSVQAVFTEAVVGSTNPPPSASQVGEALYLAHLAVLLFWVLDRSEAQRATAELTAWVRTMMPMWALALRVPGAAGATARLLDIVRLGVLGRGPAEG